MKFLKYLVLSFAFIVMTSLVASQNQSVQAETTWNLVWNDEFDGVNGSAPDPTKWGYDIGGHGWGNNELQYYTDRRENSYIENGDLVIKAIKENYEGNEYTSARLLTKGKFSTTYGKIEARIKVPYGQGLWSAFWMLGADIDQVGWPNSGEIDIMENVGYEPTSIHGTVHGPRYSGANGIGQSYTLSSGEFKDDYHVFAVEWEPEQIRWYVDGNLYHTLSSSDLSKRQPWVFDHEFFIILNVAVGGNWPGYPDSTSVFPQTMNIDYVRVYEQSGGSTSQQEPSAPTNLSAIGGRSKVDLSWDAVANAESYNIYQKTATGTYQLVDTVNSTSTTIRRLNSGETYYYTVTAVNQYGESTSSTEVSAVVQ